LNDQGRDNGIAIKQLKFNKNFDGFE